MKNVKRILTVAVKREYDSDGDTSYLGEYARKADSEFSIDRKHSLDCPCQPFNEALRQPAIDKLERIILYLNRPSNLPGSLFEYQKIDGDDEAQDLLIAAQDELAACTCDESGDMQRNELQFFNPGSHIEPFKSDASWIPADVEDKESYWREVMCKGALSNYARMEGLGNSDWGYIGISATAEYQLTSSGPVQRLHSGGIWGIESDSDDSYLSEVETEELGTLKDELEALGFSKRAIGAAFKTSRGQEMHAN